MEKVRLEELQQIKAYVQEQIKGKEFKNLSTNDKDLILEAIAKMLGLID